MITEKLMMPYVFATQHKIVHLTMAITMLLIYNIQDEEIDWQYYDYKFEDMFKNYNDTPPSQITILRAFWIMFAVHIVCIVLELTIDLIQNKWGYKNNYSKSSPF